MAMNHVCCLCRSLFSNPFQSHPRLIPDSVVIRELLIWLDVPQGNHCHPPLLSEILRAPKLEVGKRSGGVVDESPHIAVAPCGIKTEPSNIWNWVGRLSGE